MFFLVFSSPLWFGSRLHPFAVSLSLFSWRERERARAIRSIIVEFFCGVLIVRSTQFFLWHLSFASRSLDVLRFRLFFFFSLLLLLLRADDDGGGGGECESMFHFFFSSICFSFPSTKSTRKRATIAFSSINNKHEIVEIVETRTFCSLWFSCCVYCDSNNKSHLETMPTKIRIRTKFHLCPFWNGESTIEAHACNQTLAVHTQTKQLNGPKECIV